MIGSAIKSITGSLIKRILGDSVGVPPVLLLQDGGTLLLQDGGELLINPGRVLWVLSTAFWVDSSNWIDTESWTD